MPVYVAAVVCVSHVQRQLNQMRDGEVYGVADSPCTAPVEGVHDSLTAGVDCG